jgi:hypothetical protein
MNIILLCFENFHRKFLKYNFTKLMRSSILFESKCNCYCNNNYSYNFLTKYCNATWAIQFFWTWLIRIFSELFQLDFQQKKETVTLWFIPFINFRFWSTYSFLVLSIFQIYCINLFFYIIFSLLFWIEKSSKLNM